MAFALRIAITRVYTQYKLDDGLKIAASQKASGGVIYNFLLQRA